MAATAAVCESSRRRTASRSSTSSGSRATFAASCPWRARPAGRRPSSRRRRSRRAAMPSPRRRRAADFDVYADTQSQQYGGVAAETPATNAAVATTTGEVVTYGGTPVTTYLLRELGRRDGGHPERVPGRGRAALAPRGAGPLRPQPLRPDDAHAARRGEEAARAPGGHPRANRRPATRRLAADPHRRDRWQRRHDNRVRDDARRRVRPAEHVGVLHRHPGVGHAGPRLEPAVPGGALRRHGADGRERCRPA